MEKEYETTVSENRAEQFLVAMLMAIRDGERKATMGGLLMLFKHLEQDGEMPTTFVNNILEEGQK